MTKEQMNIIYSLANKYKFSVTENVASVHIKTNIGDWRIDEKKSKLLLYHKSLRGNPKKRKYNEDYHFQKEVKNVYHALNYIHTHDKTKFLKQKNIDILFEKLEKGIL